MPVTLFIANKAYSSWSMRPWLLMASMGIPFEEVVIPMARPDSKKKMLKHSPAGKMPALKDGDVIVYESIAVIEYIAEKYPQKNIWPKNKAARALARSLSAEMHAGFQALRQHCPTVFRRPVKARELTPEAALDVARLESAFANTRKAYGRGGPFLFGKFTAVDAMFAPIVTRLHIYDIKVSKTTRAYMDAIMALPAYQAWIKDAAKEKWAIEKFDVI
jgi:glutathione S-transferase